MRKIVTLVSLVLGWPLSAAAAGPPAPPVIVAEFLGFSDSQAEQFGRLLQALQTAVAGLEPEIAAKQRDLEELAGGDAADPQAVGRAFLDVRALQGQVGRALEAYQEGVAALLGPEQMERAQAVIRAAQILPAVQAFVALPLVAPPQ